MADELIRKIELAIANADAVLLERLVRENTDDVQVMSELDELLLVAVKCACRRCVEVLLDAGANVDGSDQQGNTAVFWATTMNNVDIVIQLLAHGANPSQVNDDGHNAIYQSRLWQRQEIESIFYARATNNGLP